MEELASPGEWERDLRKEASAGRPFIASAAWREKRSRDMVDVERTMRTMNMLISKTSSMKTTAEGRCERARVRVAVRYVFFPQRWFISSLGKRLKDEAERETD